LSKERFDIIKIATESRNAQLHTTRETTLTLWIYSETFVAVGRESFSCDSRIIGCEHKQRVTEMILNKSPINSKTDAIIQHLNAVNVGIEAKLNGNMVTFMAN
jgi:hypothetical protein